jgi:hypothetical protein
VDPSRCTQPVGLQYACRPSGSPLVSGVSVGTHWASPVRSAVNSTAVQRRSLDACTLGRLPYRGERLHHRSKRKQPSTSRDPSSSPSSCRCVGRLAAVATNVPLGSASRRVNSATHIDPRPPVSPVYLSSLHEVQRQPSGRSTLPAAAAPISPEASPSPWRPEPPAAATPLRLAGHRGPSVAPVPSKLPTVL